MGNTTVKLGPKRIAASAGQREFLASIAGRRLNTRDKTLAAEVYLSPEEHMADMLDSQSAFNMRELATAISKEKRPEVRKLLEEEQAKLFATVADTAGLPVSTASGTDSASSAGSSDSADQNTMAQIRGFLTNLLGIK